MTEPFSKSELSDSIEQFLFDNIELSVRKRTNDLLKRSIEKSGFDLVEDQNTFFQVEHEKGILNYRHNSESAEMAYAGKIVMLDSHVDLLSEFDALQIHCDALESEKAKLAQYVRVILNECENIADLHLAFPDTVHHILPELGVPEKPTINEDAFAKRMAEVCDYGEIIKQLFLMNHIHK